MARGFLGGLAFWAVGIDGAIFWGTVTSVFSIIAGVGGALVWVPAAIILMTSGMVWRGIALALFCALIVGSVDNVLRPRLVGQDTGRIETVGCYGPRPRSGGHPAAARDV